MTKEPSPCERGSIKAVSRVRQEWITKRKPQGIMFGKGSVDGCQGSRRRLQNGKVAKRGVFQAGWTVGVLQLTEGERHLQQVLGAFLGA